MRNQALTVRVIDFNGNEVDKIVRTDLTIKGAASQELLKLSLRRVMKKCNL